MKTAQIQAMTTSAPPAATEGQFEAERPLLPGLEAQQQAALRGHRLESLPLGATGDRYEQEADRTAEQVIERLETGASPAGSVQTTPTPGPAVQAKGDGGASSGSAAGFSAAMLTQLPAAPGGGRQLEPAVRSPMERAFGANLGGVRLHTGQSAQLLNRSLHARATTAGRDIYFDQGQYDPDSTAGRELLAHELTHVLQQQHNGARIQRWPWDKKGKKKGNDSIPLLEMGAGRSDEGESAQNESDPSDFDLASPSSSSAATGSRADDAQMESSDFDLASPSSSSASAGSEAGEALMAPSDMAIDLRIRAMEMIARAKEMIVLHQNYKRHKENLQGRIGRALNMILDVSDKILSIVEKVDGSGVTAVVHASISLLRKLGDLIYEAHSILSNNNLREQLQPLLGPKVDFGALIKESFDFGKAIKAVVDTATKVA